MLDRHHAFLSRVWYLLLQSTPFQEHTQRVLSQREKRDLQRFAQKRI